MYVVPFLTIQCIGTKKREKAWFTCLVLDINVYSIYLGRQKGRRGRGEEGEFFLGGGGGGGGGGGILRLIL